jgi:DNA-binding transcriptional ArsR family regulator
MKGDVFQAIADDTRRRILHLTHNNPMHVNAVCEYFNISRPAVSKHLKILSEAGLLEIKRKGRHRICVSKLGKLKGITDWISGLSNPYFTEPETDSFANFLKRLS